MLMIDTAAGFRRRHYLFFTERRHATLAFELMPLKQLMAY